MVNISEVESLVAKAREIENVEEWLITYKRALGSIRGSYPSRTYVSRHGPSSKTYATRGNKNLELLPGVRGCPVQDVWDVLDYIAYFHRRKLVEDGGTRPHRTLLEHLRQQCK